MKDEPDKTDKPEKTKEPEKESSEPSDDDINAYLEELMYGLKDERRIDVLKATYADVLNQSEDIAVQKEQAQRMKDDARENLLAIAARKNFKRRRDTVIELRRLGEKIKDKWVPDTATN